MEDIGINIGEYKLNLRVAAIIIHNNKVLLHKAPQDPYYAFIGGHLKIGEQTRTAIKREIKEELGKEIKILSSLGYVENFFNNKKEKYHEIMFLYKAEFCNEEDKKIEKTLQNIEQDQVIIYEWIDINKLDEYDIRPKQAKEIIKSNEPHFIVNNEINDN